MFIHDAMDMLSEEDKWHYSTNGHQAAKPGDFILGVMQNGRFSN